MKISVIIPTLNEENFLPKLLKDLKEQTFKDFEIIVADAGSKDKTRTTAKRYGAKVVKGGMPAVGRNNGARAAKGGFLFFLDADVRITKNFLAKAYKEIQKKFLDLATCDFKPISSLILDKVMHKLAVIYIKMSQFSSPHAPGCCVMVSKRLFERVDGFDESLKLAEDHDFVRRASKFRQLRILDSVGVKVSIRRLGKEGRFVLMSKYIHSEIYRMFKGEIKEDIIKYEFGDFRKKEGSKLEERLKTLEKNLNKIDRRYQNLRRKGSKKFCDDVLRLKNEVENRILLIGSFIKKK